MIKQVLAQLDYTAWAEGALVLFAGVFVAVVIHTLRSDRAGIQAAAELPFHDDPGEIPQ